MSHASALTTALLRPRLLLLLLLPATRPTTASIILSTF